MKGALTDFIEQLHYHNLSGEDLSTVEIRLPSSIFEHILYDINPFPQKYMTKSDDPFDIVFFKFMGINVIKK